MGVVAAGDGFEQWLGRVLRRHPTLQPLVVFFGVLALAFGMTVAFQGGRVFARTGNCGPAYETVCPPGVELLFVGIFAALLGVGLLKVYELVCDLKGPALYRFAGPVGNVIIAWVWIEISPRASFSEAWARVIFIVTGAGWFFGAVVELSREVRKYRWRGLFWAADPTAPAAVNRVFLVADLAGVAPGVTAGVLLFRAVT